MKRACYLHSVIFYCLLTKAILHDILFDVFMVAFLYVMGNFRGGEHF